MQQNMDCIGMKWIIYFNGGIPLATWKPKVRKVWYALQDH
jgi:hypothetical protein